MSDQTTATISIDALKRVGIIAQNQKDMFLIRLRTVGGDLNAEELSTITRVSQKYGRGEVHLTTRQAVEIPFVHADNLDNARRELEENGIVLGVCGPRGRGIVACPGTAVCTSAIMETKELAAELDGEFFRQEAPHKFKIGVSGCPNSCSKPIENDIGIMGGVLPRWDREACVSCRLCVSICPTGAIDERNDVYILDEEKCIHCGLCIKNCSASAWTAKKAGYTLLLGGTLGKKPRLGTKAIALVETREELIGHVRRAFAFYRANGRKKERFGHTLDRIGVEKSFAEIFSGAVADRSEAASTAPDAATDHPVRDLRGVGCPLNYVHAKLALEKVCPGEWIEFWLDEGEPLVNVTRTMKDDGHRVLSVVPKERFYRVLVEKRRDVRPDAS